jgi:hypothetical protein
MGDRSQQQPTRTNKDGGFSVCRFAISGSFRLEF